MAKSLTREIEACAKGLGADIVGVASVQPYERLCPHELQKPTKILRGSQSVVVFGVAMLSGPLEGEEVDLMRSMAVDSNLKIDRMGFEIATFIEHKGYLAVNISSGIPVDFAKRHKGMWGYVSHRHLAVEAGLGEMGLNNSFLHEEFGPRIYLGSVITTAPLTFARDRKEGICLGADCSHCIEACPAQSLTGDGTNEVDKCREFAHPYGLASYLRFMRKLLSAKNEQKQKEMLYSLDSLYLWQALLTRWGTFGGCFACITACPVGANKRKLS